MAKFYKIYKLKQTNKCYSVVMIVAHIKPLMHLS